MNVEDVSVVMTNYNYAQFLPRAVKAVFSQQVRPREFIVIDDCSTDNSPQILEHLSKQDSLLKVIRNEKNCGTLATVNRAHRLVTSKYAIFLSSDDYILPGMIKRSMELLRENPTAGLSCAYHSVIKEPAGEILPNPSQWCDRPRFISSDELTRMIGPNCPAGHTAVYRNDALLHAGGFDASLRWHCDWFVNLVLAFRHGLCHIPDTIALLSQRETSYSAAGTRNPLDQQEVLRNILKRLASPDNADVLPLFQSSGVMTVFGENLIRAAASMDDRWTPGVLGLLAGMNTEVYESLLQDENAEVRELSRFLLGPMWWRRKEHLESLTSEIDRLRGEVKRLEEKSGWKFHHWVAAAKKLMKSDLTVPRTCKQ